MRNLIFIMPILWSSVLWSQQDAQLSLYLKNPTQFNPAHAGTNGTLRVTAISRLQWTGWEQAPRTQCFTAHNPLFNSRLGLGFSVLSDASGARSYSEVMGQVAYHLPTIEGGVNLSAGLSFGLQSDGFNFGDMYAVNMNDDWITTPFQQTNFNMGIGFLANLDRLYVSVGIPRIFEYALGNSAPIGRRLSHFYWTTGYTHSLNSVLDLRFCGLVKSVADAPSSVDMNLELWIQETLSVGTMVRFNEGMGVQGSYRFKDGWRVHYGVDFPLNGLMQRSFGSHELGIAWDFGKRPVAFVNPRYF